MAAILWCWCPSVVKSTSKEFLSFPFKRFSTTTDRFYLIGHHEKRTAAAAAAAAAVDDGWGSVEDLNDSLKKGEREKNVSRFFPYFSWPLGPEGAIATKKERL